MSHHNRDPVEALTDLLEKRINVEMMKFQQGIQLERDKFQQGIQLEREKLMTDEDRNKFRREMEAKKYSSQLTEWIDCKCSWFTPRSHRIKIENNLIAETAVNRKENLPELQQVFTTTTCQNRYGPIQEFLAHL